MAKSDGNVPATPASSLPGRTTLEDVQAVCGYLIKKPTGVTLKEMRAVLDAKHLDQRRLGGLKRWGLIEESADRFRLTERGRRVIKDNGAGRGAALQDVVRETEPYLATVERAAHNGELTVSAVDAAAHWHENFKTQVSSNDESLNEQVVSYFQLAEGADLGKIVVGRRGQPTRFEFDKDAVERFVDGVAPTKDGEAVSGSSGVAPEVPPPPSSPVSPASRDARHSELQPKPIFVGHGKNKAPLNQLVQLLNTFQIPHKVVVDEANLGRPISEKVRDTIRACGSAILIFTRDQKFLDEAGNDVWRPSENVIYELGATSYEYENRIVIFKEKGLSFPTNFQNIGYIEFEVDAIQARTAELLKELIGFGLVRVTPTR